MNTNVHSLMLAQVQKEIAERGKTLHPAEEWALNRDAYELIDTIATGQGLREAALIIWIAWPGLQRCAVKFVRHVGVRYPGKRASLAHESLGSALRLYQQNVNPSRPTDAPSAFLRELVVHASQILNRELVGVKANGRQVVWDCLQRPMTQWIRQEAIEWLYLDDVPYLGTAELIGGVDYLAHQVMGHREYGLMKEASLRAPS